MHVFLIHLHWWTTFNSFYLTLFERPSLTSFHLVLNLVINAMLFVFYSLCFGLKYCGTFFMNSWLYKHKQLWGRSSFFKCDWNNYMYTINVENVKYILSIILYLIFNHVNLIKLYFKATLKEQQSHFCYKLCYK